MAMTTVLQAETPVDFQRDVQPIFAEHCRSATASMPTERKADCGSICAKPRLKGGDSGTPAIVPGKPDESELIRRDHVDRHRRVMPPPSHHKPLSANRSKR